MSRDDEEKFRETLIGVIPHLRAFARSLVYDPADADDLVQETVAKALSSRSQFKMGTNLRAWTFMILRNRFLSDKRKSWRQSQLDPETAERTLEAASDPSAALELDDVRRALRQLPHSQREALILVGAGGLSYEEAAEIAQVAVGTVKSRLNRARLALNEIIEKQRVTPGGDSVSAADAMGEILAEIEARVGEAQR